MKQIFQKIKTNFQEKYKKHGKKFILFYVLWLVFKWTVGAWVFSYLWEYFN